MNVAGSVNVEREGEAEGGGSDAAGADDWLGGVAGDVDRQLDPIAQRAGREQSTGQHDRARGALIGEARQGGE